MDAAWYGYFSILIFLQRLVDSGLWRSEKSTQIFLVAMTEATTKSSLRKKEFILVSSDKGRVPCDRRGMACQKEQGSVWSHFHPYPGRRQREQEVGVGYPSSKATPSDFLPPARLQLLQVPSPPPKALPAGTKYPKPHKSMWGISHSNHHS